MSDIPSDLKYTKTHEWARLDDDGLVVVGITDHAQQLLGDMVFVELPELEHEVGAGEEVCVVESVKAASDVYMPIGGEVVAANNALSENPALVNEDAFGGGWLFKIKPEDENAFEELLDAEAYEELVEDESD